MDCATYLELPQHSMLLQGFEASHYQGSKLTEKSSRKRYENVVAISQILVTKSPRCIVLSAVCQKNTSPQYLCVKKPLQMANDRRNGAVHVTSQLNYSTITLSSEKFTARNKIILSFIYFSKSSSKVATANPFVSKE